MKQPAYENITYRQIGALQNTDNVMNNMFWIGVYPGLTNEMILYIISKIEKFMNNY